MLICEDGQLIYKMKTILFRQIIFPYVIKEHI